MHALIAELFGALGHPARITLLQALRDGERTLGALQAELGLDSGETSEHLAALRERGLVARRRQAGDVHYGVSDSRVLALLDAAKAILVTSVEQHHVLVLLDDLGDEQLGAPPAQTPTRH